MSEVVAGSDLRMNVLRYRRHEALAAALKAVDVLVPSGGDVTAEASRTLQAGAWVSGGAARAAFVQELAGAGRAVASAWGGQVEQTRSLWVGEPVQVDPADHRQGWKASTLQIEARVTSAVRGSGVS